MKAAEESRGYRSATLLACLALVLAGGWLVLRVFIRLDFTDEMQYYGEISGLVRTGKFFHDDLFLQQLCYLFLLPFFRVHALVFPDQSYLILFGRLLLAATYAGTGLLFWRCISGAGNYTTTSKLSGLALILAWTPLNLFAPSYNSLAYLVVIAVVSVWLIREQLPAGRYLVTVGALIPSLGLIHPTSGVALSALLLGETWLRRGFRSAAWAAAALAGGAAALIATLLLVHGADFPTRFAVALRFTGAFAGTAMARFHHIPAWGMLIGIGAVTIFRLQWPQRLPLPPVLRKPVLKTFAVLFVAIGAWVLCQTQQPWNLEFFKLATCGLAAVLVVALFNRSESALKPQFRWLGAGLALAAAILLYWFAQYWSAGYFAACVFVGVALALPFGAQIDARRRVEFFLIGIYLGTIFAFTSGNGLMNFGYGIAAVLPFLALQTKSAPEATPAPARNTGPLFALVMPAMACLLVLNGWFWPYREQPGLSRFAPVQDVPAFRGIWTSSVKHAAIRLFRRLPGDDSLVGKRLLIAGPQPWLYFLHRSRPNTPMLFMHFIDGEKAEPIIAAELFTHGEPEALLITNSVPPVVHAKLQEWIAAGCVARQIKLSEEFIGVFRTQSPYLLSSDVLLLTRTPKPSP